MPQDRIQNQSASSRELLCPSSRGTSEDSVLIGVVTQGSDRPMVLPIARGVAVTPELLRLSEPASPTEVFRFASPCQSGRCLHFQNTKCQLAVRSVELLETVTEDLPECSIRSSCRWFRQEGASICKRCPQVVTDQFSPSDVFVQIVCGAQAESRTEKSLPTETISAGQSLLLRTY